MVRSLKNGRLSPINRIPPEVLTLIPDFWHTGYRDKGLIALTHVRQAWREMFVSRSLWTKFDCTNANKTRIYLERSKSSPINLSLGRRNALFSSDPFFHIIPLSVGRLKSLSITTMPENLHVAATYLSAHTPLLERLDIHAASSVGTFHPPTLTTAPSTSLPCARFDSNGFTRSHRGEAR